MSQQQQLLKQDMTVSQVLRTYGRQFRLDRTARDLTGFRKWPPIHLALPCIRLDLSYVSSGAPYIIFTTNYEKVGSTRQTTLDLF